MKIVRAILRKWNLIKHTSMLEPPYQNNYATGTTPFKTKNALIELCHTHPSRLILTQENMTVLQ